MLSSEEILRRAKEILGLANQKKMLLRVMGSCAIELHCPKYVYFHKILGRPLTDIDFVTYSKFRSEVERFFTGLGYKKSKSKLVEMQEKQRHIYYDKTTKLVIDIFFDKLDMCHTIDFRGRLEKDSPTIPLADILLEKMQIVQLNVKDIIDTIVLLREHQVGSTEKEVINADYIATLLSKDWGFYYTVTTNLVKVRDFLLENKNFTDEDRNDVCSKINRLVDAVEKKPKSLRWKMRKKIGTRIRWYNIVE